MHCRVLLFTVSLCLCPPGQNSGISNISARLFTMRGLHLPDVIHPDLKSSSPPHLPPPRPASLRSAPRNVQLRSDPHSASPTTMAAFVPGTVALPCAAPQRAAAAAASASRPAVRMAAPAGDAVGRRAVLAALAAGAVSVAATSTGSPAAAAEAAGEWVTTATGLKYKDGAWRTGGGRVWRPVGALQPHGQCRVWTARR